MQKEIRSILQILLPSSCDENLVEGVFTKLKLSALSELRNLQILNLEYNQITDISVLPELKNLRELYLSGNPINDYSALNEMSMTRVNK